MGYIYLITNTLNKKQYVGQTICKDINSRWNQHKRKDTKTIGNYLKSAYEKYGIENFRFQIICICFDEDCNRYEEEYIKKFNTLAPNGYNLASGGKNSKPHPSTLEKRAEKMRGKKFRPRTEEEKKILSEARKGDKNPNFGKKMSEEQRKKISETMKKLNKEILVNTGRASHENTLKALEEGKRKSSKKVGKYDKNGALLETYKSLSEAGRKNNMGYQHISKVCNGYDSYNTAGGFVWKFLSDDTITS